MLSPATEAGSLAGPVATSNTSLDSRIGAGGKDEAANDDDDDEEGPQRPAYWPDEWTPAVAVYLGTVQGGAKARLVQKLQQAAQQPLPAPPPEPIAAAVDASIANAAAAATTTGAPAPASAGPEKSVRFGDMAMLANEEATTTAAAANAASAVASAQQKHARVVFERARARVLLEHMGEPIWA